MLLIYYKATVSFTMILFWHYCIIYSRFTLSPKFISFLDDYYVLLFMMFLDYDVGVDDVVDDAAADDDVGNYDCDVDDIDEGVDDDVDNCYDIGKFDDNNDDVDYAVLMIM